MVITELWDKMGQSKEQQKANFENTGKKLPVGFVATPEDVSTFQTHMCSVEMTCSQIAEAYLYAVRADYANGTLITIDGGRWRRYDKRKCDHADEIQAEYYSYSWNVAINWILAALTN